MDVAIVTYAGLPQLNEYDAPILPALAALGLDARPCLWDDPKMDWRTPKVAVIRTTWDSHLRRDAFVAWASKAGQLTRLYNPPEVLRWNTHKAYLRELEARGIPFTPTIWVPPRGHRGARHGDARAPLGHRGAQARRLRRGAEDIPLPPLRA